MKIKRWLVYYKQRPHGTDRWIEANGVTDLHPAAFLLHLQTRFDTHQSLVMWATLIEDDDTAAGLIGNL